MKKKPKQDSVIESKLPTDEAVLTNKEVAKSVAGSTAQDTVLKTNVIPDGFSTTERVASVTPSPVGISGASGPFTAVSYGGTRLTGSDSSSSLSSQSKSARSDTREGKRIDSTVKKINSIVSEQVEVEYKEAKPINETDSPQGYTGRYVDKHFRTSKVNGSHPGDLLFDRSLDEITRDELNFIEGQYLKGSNELDDHEPLYKKTTSGTPGAIKLTADNIEDYVYSEVYGVNYDCDGTAIAINDYVKPTYLIKGNYVAKSLTINVTADGAVSLSIVDDDITPSSNIDGILDTSSQNALTFANQTELDRQVMESKAGNENADNWSPLPLAIKHPTRINGTLRSIEADTGSSIFAAISKLKLGLSYQINKAAKDGQRFNTIGEMCTTGANAMSSAASDTRDQCFPSFGPRDNGATIAGRASTIIAVYDSTPKYNNRADVLTQPRSLKMHLATAEHYAKQFMVYENFARHFIHSEAFSYIGSEYDPFLPVCITDAETEVHAFKWSDFLTSTGVPRSFAYSYGNVRNTMTQRVFHPLIAGIYDWACSYAGKLTPKAGGNPNSFVFPIIHGTKFLSGWDALVCAAMPFIAKRRIQSMHDVIDYTDKNGYPYSGLISMDQALALPYKNFSFVSIEEPLNVGKMNDAQSLTWLLPELPIFLGKFDPTIAASDLFYYMMPWYFSNKSFDYSVAKTGLLSSAVTLSTTPSMSMPSLRSGTIRSTLKKLYDVSEREIRLTYDMMTSLPRQSTLAADQAFLVYKHGQSNDGIPVVGYSSALTVGDLLKTPRELGMNIVVPANYLRINSGIGVDSAAALNTAWYGDTSYCAYAWRANISAAELPAGDLPDIVQVRDRGASLSQTWDNIPATAAGYAVAMALGLYLGLNCILDNFGLVVPAVASTTPLCDIDDSGLTGTTTSNLPESGLYFTTFSRAVWYVIQRLPMIMSPWDLVVKQSTDQNDILGTIDPFEVSYWFGLAGFRASDFAEDVTNRAKKRSIEGITYVRDLFLEDCPVLK